MYSQPNRILHKRYRARYRISSPNVSQNAYNNTSSLDRRLLTRNLSECEMMGFRYGPAMSAQWSTRTSSVASDADSLVARPRDAWRKMFSMNEIDVATNGFSRANVIGSGEYGTVYCGVLFDNTRVAVKKLLISSLFAPLVPLVPDLWGTKPKFSAVTWQLIETLAASFSPRVVIGAISTTL
uniref:non-specific serine/threonine protein kinase n=1 Tax=Cannabis sativa TaxID=3483 RepID=A0A803PQB0_CANSA